MTDHRSPSKVPKLSSSSADEIEWIHCNNCFADVWSSLPNHQLQSNYLNTSSPPVQQQSRNDQLPTGLSRFAIAQCGHILCVSCVYLSYNPQATHLVQCPVCNEVVQYNPLCGEDGLLQSDLSIYFAPLLPQLPPILTALEFRQRNTDSLLRFLKTKLHLQRQAIQKAAKELKSLREVQGQYSAVIHENETLKSQLKESQSKLYHHRHSHTPSHQPPFRMPNAAASAVSRPAYTLPHSTKPTSTPSISSPQHHFITPQRLPNPTFPKMHTRSSEYSLPYSPRHTSTSTHGSIDEQQVFSYSLGARVNSVAPHPVVQPSYKKSGDLKRSFSLTSPRGTQAVGRKRSHRPGTTIPGKRR